MSTMTFERVGRPENKKADLHIFGDVLLKTLTLGDAIAIPINGEAYAVVHNRISVRVRNVAKEHGVQGRTRQSEDGLSVLAWLEPKR